MYSSRLGTIIAVAGTSGLLATAMVAAVCAATPVEEQSLKAALEQGSDEAGSEFRQLWRDVEAQTERMIADAIAGWDEPNTVVGDRRELIVKVAYLPSAPARSTACWNVTLVNALPASNATADALCGVALDALRAGNGDAPSAHARLIGIPALGVLAMMWMA